MTREEQRVAYVELRKQLLPHPPIADATKWVQTMSDKQFDRHWISLANALHEQRMEQFKTDSENF